MGTHIGEKGHEKVGKQYNFQIICKHKKTISSEKRKRERAQNVEKLESFVMKKENHIQFFFLPFSSLRVSALNFWVWDNKSFETFPDIYICVLHFLPASAFLIFLLKKIKPLMIFFLRHFCCVRKRK
jgi:hypothetical protein